MHPLFSRIVALGAYLLLWASLGNAMAIVLTLRYHVAPWPAAVLGVTPLAVFYGLACLAAWFVCRAFPVDRGPQLLPAALAQGAAATVTSAVWVGIGLWWLRTTGAPFVPTSLDGVVAWLVGGAFLFLLSAAVHYVFLAVQASERARRHALESAVLAREAELRALRAQVNPHFLYNSLHSIAALAQARPTDAQQMAIGLGEFLRQSLRLGGLPSVTLEQEVSLARQYLAIEQVRYGTRLAVFIDVADEVTRCELPPLLLQPLVENAIKHGVAGLLEGGTISLAAAPRGDHCEVEIRNPYDPDEPRHPGTRVGLDNVRARLLAHFGNRSTMDTDDADATFVVRLRWPMALAPSQLSASRGVSA